MISLIPWLVLTAGGAAVAYRLRRERLLSFWLIWSGLIHIFMEASYGTFSWVVQSRATTTFTQFLLSPAPLSAFIDPRWWANVYTQYARYDGRYAEHDPVVIFICYTELLLGPLCFLLVWLIQKSSPYRHRVQLILCTAQFYGTVLYFVAPMLQGSWSRVMSHDPFELAVYVFGLNALWMIVPGIMIYRSLRQPTTPPQA